MAWPRESGIDTGSRWLSRASDPFTTRSAIKPHTRAGGERHANWKSGSAVILSRVAFFLALLKTVPLGQSYQTFSQLESLTRPEQQIEKLAISRASTQARNGSRFIASVP